MMRVTFYDLITMCAVYRMEMTSHCTLTFFMTRSVTVNVKSDMTPGLANHRDA